MQASIVAKYIINKCIELEKPVSNLQLQKIMYFVHLGFLKKTSQKLIKDESFKAWQYGPVIESIYFEYKIFGGNKINIPENGAELNLESDKIDIIDKIIEESINLPPWELVQRSHIKNGAWAKHYKENEKNYIPDNSIEEEALN